MKKLIFTIFSIVSAFTIMAQAPDRISYQAIVTDANNQIISNKTVAIKFSIIRDSPSGTVVYIEQQSPKTSDFGQISVQIGGGTALAGSMSTIDWKSGVYYLKTEIDPNGGSSFTINGTVQFASVPYALYASTSGNAQPGAPGDKGADGNPGQTGDSAYDIWLSLGNSGTKADFINWLKGPKGYDGSSSGNEFKHFIGEEYGGGIVFHLWLDNQGKEHGLVLDKNDLSASIEYSNFYKSTTAATSFWDGASNTSAILEEADYNTCSAFLVSLSKNGGYSDWYIPAIDEMNLIFQNLFIINKALSSISNATPISVGKNSNSSEYWTSNGSEDGTGYAYTFRFVQGDYTLSAKIFNHRLRTIRKF